MTWLNSSDYLKKSLDYFLKNFENTKQFKNKESTFKMHKFKS